MFSSSQISFLTIAAVVTGVAAAGVYFATRAPAPAQDDDDDDDNENQPKKLTPATSLVSASSAPPHHTAAVCFCERIYRDQKHEITGEPLLSFVLRVSRSLQDCGVQDATVLLASLLFATDALEHLERIMADFGPPVAALMQEVREAQIIFRVAREGVLPGTFRFFSQRAKMVIFAQHVDILREILESQPRGWTQWKVSNHFQRAQMVLTALEGVNDALEAELDSVLHSYHYGPSPNSSVEGSGYWASSLESVAGQ